MVEFLIVGAVLFALSEQVLATIVVATITAVGGIVIAFIQSLKRENKNDHMSNQSILLQIDEKIDHIQERLEDRMTRIENKVDNHIGHHAHKEGSRARKR